MPYRCTISRPQRRARARRAGAGGAPPVATHTDLPSTVGPAGSAVSVERTVGAAHRWVTEWSAMAFHTAPASTLSRQTCVAPAAVTAQVKHQPLQWNMGSVHR